MIMLKDDDNDDDDKSYSDTIAHYHSRQQRQ